MNALVAIRDLRTRSSLVEALEKRGHTITLAASEELADRLHGAPLPLFIALESRLEGSDVAAICRRIRSAPGGKRAFILAIAEPGSLEDIPALLDAGASDYIERDATAAHIDLRIVIAERRGDGGGDGDGDGDARASNGARSGSTEATVQNYLDVAEVLFVGIGADERVLLINRKGCELLGYSEAEIIGKSWFDMFLPERVRDDVRGVFKKVLAEDLGTVEYYENPIVTKSGEERLIAWHNASLRDERGVVTVSLSSGSDVTESRSAEEALRRSESVLRSFYDSAPFQIGIVELLDDEVRLVSCNAATAAFYGKPLSEVEGRTITELGGNEAVRRLLVEQYTEVLQKQQPVCFAIRGDTGLARRSLQVTVTQIPTPPDRPPLFSYLTDDVTEREDMQARLLLSDRMASLGTLAAGIAHEINNPLAYVATNLDILASHASLASHAAPALEKGAAVNEMMQAVAQAREGVERVRQIVKGLRTFSRGDDDRREPTSVEDVLESSIKMVWNEIRHRAELVRDYAGVPPVVANEARLGQLFLNLLVNAAHAIPEGRVSANTIRVTTRAAPGDRVLVEVCDTGSGIPTELMVRIFDPFFTTRPVGSGTGLGLSICHGIVKALGGELTVESEVGKGSTFRVTLDAAPRPVRPASSLPPPIPAQRRGRILIIDDEPLLRMSLRSLLGGEHDVTTASSARDALARIGAGERFDVLLCDLMMPEMTGMDLYDRLRESAPDQSDRMIFLTGGVFTARAQAFLERVPNLCLEKPFNIDGLRDVIQKRLG